jgi:chromosome segregation ATPase
MKTEQEQSAEEITLEECMDEVAMKYNYAHGKSYANWGEMELILCATPSGTRNLISRVEEAAELYASLKTKSLQDQLEAKEKEYEGACSKLSSLATVTGGIQNELDSLKSQLSLLQSENEKLREEVKSERAQTWEYTNLRSEVERLREALDVCDEALAMLEDTTHGTEGKNITSARGKIQSALPE